MDWLGDGVLRLEAALVARERLHARIAANIANADTPNYRADRTRFADLLAEARRELGLPAPSAPLRLPMQPAAPLRMDGNDVDVHAEMARLAENQMMQAYTAELLKRELDGILQAIHEGGR